ncbi:Penicillin-binding protein 4* [Caulifigura coniformis]|uniref:Penicillin-binding protein 4 n=1 Tax=Caulifigura coniformis TaxID=2527983 RepID=A0A517SG80_9PLAN|nr:serine hydrolase domain-containing protein [Caulifigura coniformis]QDT55110.1 Penicillin-binding protein 4* [Caulifigura coniformis]
MSVALLSTEEVAARFPLTLAVIEKGKRQNLHFGVVASIRRGGAPFADFAVGEAADGLPLETGHLMPWLSAGKPLTAVAILRQVELGRLNLDRPVAEVIPEFAANGKHEITLKHLLTHTAGLDPAPVGWPQAPWASITERICERGVRNGFVVGQDAAYDPARSWFVLGELLRRTDGRMPHEIVQNDICRPIGMASTWMAMTPAEYAANAERIGKVAARDDKGALKATHTWAESFWTAPSPGSSMRGPVHELALFYEMLLRGGALNGTRILAPETVLQMTARHREGRFDSTFQHQVDFGLGVLLDSNHYGAETVPYGFGRHSSPQAFGHGGAQTSIGFCDPEHELVVAWVANGAPGEAQHNRRNRDLNSAIYRDLGLGNDA